MYKERLKEVREINNTKQKEIAKYIGIHKGLYSQYENEYAIIPSKHLNSVINYFNISLDYLFNFTNRKQYKVNKNSIDKKTSGERLKEFRKDNKLTQVKLAEFLNTTHSVIADYERGRYLIATPFLYTICKKYQISADYLLGKTDVPKYLK